jgi:hypothetical protein
MIAPTQSQNQGSNLERELIPVGTYLARCYSIIHYGSIKSKKFKSEEFEYKDQLEFTFEIPELTKVFNQDRGPQPLVKGLKFNFSMSKYKDRNGVLKVAKLRETVETWLKRPLDEEEATAFDLKYFLGQPCVITIIHKPASNGKVYDDIGSISPMMNGMVCPDLINKLIDFDMNPNDFDQMTFDSLHNWQKTIIESSQEYQQMLRGDGSADMEKSRQAVAKPKVAEMKLQDNDESLLPF